MGLMSTPMLNAIMGRGRIHIAFELDLPDGSTIRYATADLMTDSGSYEARLKSWDIAEKRVTPWKPGLSISNSSAVVLDKDRVLSRLFAGEYEGLMAGQAARYKIISPDVASADWFPLFNGQFVTWQGRGLLPELTISLGPNDKPLKSGARLGTITTDLFPRASSDALDTPIKAIYGNHAKPNGGALSAARISPTEWLCSAGFVSDITEVYEDGYASDNAWSYQQSTRRGRNFSEIVFTSNPGDVAITFDCNGITPNGDGTGAVITNPIDILEHALVNWYFGAYEMGDWLTTAGSGAPINATYLSNVSAWMDSYGWVGKHAITQNLSGYQLINSFAENWRVVPIFWTFAGELGAAEDEFFTWKDSQSQLMPDHALSDVMTENPSDDLVDRVLIAHRYNDVDGGTSDETKAIDVSRSFNSELTVSHVWNVD